MNATTRNRLALLFFFAFVAALLWMAVSCRPKPNREARLTTERDSLQAALTACRGAFDYQQAQLEYEQINRTPARDWADDSLTRFLTRPYDLHSTGGRRP